MPFLHRYLGNPVLSFIGRLFYSIPVGDFHCGLRGFSRESMLGLGLQSPGMEFASEMVVKASLRGLRIEETPTTLKPDGRSRPPHLKTWRDGWRHLRFLLLHSPRFLFIYPGVALIVLGLVGSALLARGAVRVSPRIELDIHSLVVACFAVLIALVMFGALARRYQMVEGCCRRLSDLRSSFWASAWSRSCGPRCSFSWQARRRRGLGGVRVGGFRFRPHPVQWRDARAGHVADGGGRGDPVGGGGFSGVGVRAAALRWKRH